MTDVVTMTRELGKALQQDNRYLELMSTNAAIERCAPLQEKIAKFTALRGQIDRELVKPDKEQQNLSELDKELRAVYDEVMSSPEMVAYNIAKAEMESLMGFLNQIITGSANGQDPYSIEQNEGCSGSCSSCGGCH